MDTVIECRPGNINSRPTSETSPNPSELQTPTIKSDLYTTGRGGSGNIAANDKSNPSRARAAQDVEPPAHLDREPEGHFHWGRGGEGNLMHVKRGASKERAERKDGKLDTSMPDGTGKNGMEKRRGSMQIVVEKGKAMLGLGKEKEKEKTPDVVKE